MKNNKFKIYTLGCKVNQYDSGRLNKKLITAGFEITKNKADTAVINTCCVTKTAIHKCKRMINKAEKENPRAKIFIIGCWPKVYKEEVMALGVDLILGAGELNKFIKQIPNKLKIANCKLKINNRSRYFIKIQDGCEQFCSYCIIPYTRGKFKSRGDVEIISEIKQAVKSGYREIVLCGIHLGLYGLEKVRSKKLSPPRRDPAVAGEVKNNLVNLLKKLIKIKNLGRIRLSSIEISEVNDNLIKLIFDSKNICKHLHLPLQSGSDKILKLMNRPYDLKYYKNKIKKIRKLIPDIAITTDIIVGFPGETKKDFTDTYNFVKVMRFSRLHVFPFSAHEKTPAFKMPKKVSQKEIISRSKKLKKLGEKLKNEFKNKFIDKIVEVVIEKDIPINLRYSGKTEYYFKVEFIKNQIINKQEIKTGKIIKIKL